MRNNLLDLVSHTYDLGCIGLVKITGTDQGTQIDGLADDKSVVVSGKFHVPVSEFVGTFGMPNLDKLKVLLNLTEYKENAKITVTRQQRNAEDVPVGLNFVNTSGDFKNDYRFMTSEVVAEKLKTARFLGATWNVEFTPSVAAIQRLKMQAQANADIANFKIIADGTNLKLEFGDHSTHAGEFIFQPGVTDKLKNSWFFPVKQVMSILDLSGDRVMRISDNGAMQITVDSGLAVYNYILPAQSK
jgi:hypothetical protein